MSDPTPAEKLRALAEAVREMRAFQRAYFRDRSYDALQRSKRCEKRVDELTEDALGEPERQTRIPGT